MRYVAMNPSDGTVVYVEAGNLGSAVTHFVLERLKSNDWESEDIVQAAKRIHIYKDKPKKRKPHHRKKNRFLTTKPRPKSKQEKGGNHNGFHVVFRANETSKQELITMYSQIHAKIGHYVKVSKLDATSSSALKVQRGS